MDYSLYCFDHLTKMAATLIYGKKYVSVQAVADHDLFLHY